MKRLFLGVLLVAAIGCGHEDIPKETRCYILCDFTKSQDSISRAVIVSNADSIFGSIMSKGYYCAVFDISDEIFEIPFSELPPEASTVYTDKARKEYQDSLKTKRKKFKDTLIRVSQRSNGNTCLINSIEKIATLLAGDTANKENRNIKIILLSDMLEDCAFGAVRIDIDDGDFKTAEHALDQVNPPAFTFEGFKNIEINIVASSGKKIPVADHFRFWQKVFKRFGYNLTTSINTQLPRWVTED
ncbi:MAG: hypothetical protein JNM88_12270 [Chitinophagaceae bacterium]|nr:hypothetical protein [Chitinophagaceae bacterium]